MRLLAAFLFLLGPAYAGDVYWSDGDSGRLGSIKFRLANVDAPETGPVGSRGGAECETEREFGYEAKAFIISLTRDQPVAVTRTYGEDRYGRQVVDLSAADRDVAAAGVQAGHLRPWRHRNGKALTPKPDWCG